jgi:hypothetical protein
MNKHPQHKLRTLQAVAASLCPITLPDHPADHHAASRITKLQARKDAVAKGAPRALITAALMVFICKPWTDGRRSNVMRLQQSNLVL